MNRFFFVRFLFVECRVSVCSPRRPGRLAGVVSLTTASASYSPAAAAAAAAVVVVRRVRLRVRVSAVAPAGRAGAPHQGVGLHSLLPASFTHPCHHLIFIKSPPLRAFPTPPLPRLFSSSHSPQPATLSRKSTDGQTASNTVCCAPRFNLFALRVPPPSHDLSSFFIAFKPISVSFLFWLPAPACRTPLPPPQLRLSRHFETAFHRHRR
jgi:hypothetical protein